ncbi:MAG: imelysin family protein, partial [Pseudomonadota bacterium]
DPEEEHDCFADNTHNSHYYNAIGMQNVYLGRYVRTDGSVIKGPSVADLVAANNADVDRETRAAIDGAVAALGALKSRAETVERYDQMLAVGNDAGGQVVQAAVDALIKQARQFERGVAALQLEAIAFEGSDSLDNPSLVGTE